MCCDIRSPARGESSVRSTLLVALLVAACAANDRPTARFSALQLEAKTLCELMEDPDRYAGQRVVMKGRYVQEVHQRVLYDAHCPDWEFRVSHALAVKSDRAAARMVEQAAKKKPIVDIPVVYVGTFTVKPFIVGCSARNCQHYSLEDAQLLAASPR